jgi:sec-independent protein translocase protein TatB
MFDIGFVELMLVGIIGLLVLGPERLPQVARALGHWTGRARAAFNNLKNELEREAYNKDMQEKFKRQLEEMGLTEEDLQRGKPDILPPGDIPGRDDNSHKDAAASDDAKDNDSHR